MKKPAWLSKIKPFAGYNTYSSIMYLVSSVGPYLLLLAVMLMLVTGGYPYWMVLVLSVLAAGFYLRTFMALHDCSHSSFIQPAASPIIGHICGVLTFTPFHDWQKSHGIHHANVGNLEKRGFGDVWTMTLDEYAASKKMKRFFYRLFRNPVFLFLVAPTFLFLVMYRLPQQCTGKKGYMSIIITNVILLTVIIISYFTIGIGNYAAVQLPILFVATSTGMWLFFVQHQFEDVYWAHQEDWSLLDAAMRGSSFYKLPGVLRWFSGNIGYHNIHHINPRIPCYKLKKCYDEVTELHSVSPITLKSGYRSLFLHLWDENSGKLISFKHAMQKIKQRDKNSRYNFSNTQSAH